MKDQGLLILYLVICSCPKSVASCFWPSYEAVC